MPIAEKNRLTPSRDFTLTIRDEAPWRDTAKSPLTGPTLSPNASTSSETTSQFRFSPDICLQLLERNSHQVDLLRDRRVKSNLSVSEATNLGYAELLWDTKDQVEFQESYLIALRPHFEALGKSIEDRYAESGLSIPKSVTWHYNRFFKTSEPDSELSWTLADPTYLTVDAPDWQKWSFHMRPLPSKRRSDSDEEATSNPEQVDQEGDMDCLGSVPRRRKRRPSAKPRMRK
jgi:hypothetical protein